MKQAFKVVAIAVLLLTYLSLGWVAGLVALLFLSVATLIHLVRARRALAEVTHCPWCRAEVAQYGGFACASCHARTMGWAWRCSFCQAWSGHIACPECGMSIPNPLLR